MRSVSKYILIFYFFQLLIVYGESATAGSFSANIAVEKTDVYLGEPFIVQIQVEGADSPDTPDLSDISGFTVQEQGSRNNSTSSVTIINGRMTRTERHGYIFSYQFTAQKAGNLTIPSIEVSADGQTVRTQSVNIKVSQPSETRDFKLRMELSHKKSYVGQPLTLTVTWYIGKDVKEFQFGLPIQTDPRFKVADVNIPAGVNQKDIISISVDGREIIAKKGRRKLDGKTYTTVSFQKTVIPEKTGALVIPKATVVFNAVMGYRKRRSRSPFDSFFDDDFFFGSVNSAVTRKFVIPSNEPKLMVRNLPDSGRPYNFTGLVGEYKISASAAPTDVHVGDPITITLRVTGPAYLENVELPPLDRQKSLSRDFKIPSEIAPGTIGDKDITFTQTLRAKHADVEEIPPVELPFFDAKEGKYKAARTEPIPIQVKATRIVTAQDAEGATVHQEEKTEIETVFTGIAHNYDDPSILVNEVYSPYQWIRRPLWIGSIISPPLLYVVLFSFMRIVQMQKADPAGKQSRRAYGELLRKLNSCKNLTGADSIEVSNLVLDALRQYLGSKLQQAAGAITYNDIEETLRKRGIDIAVLQSLKKLFEDGEAIRFAGSAYSDNRSAQHPFIDRAINIGKELEQNLK